MKQARFLRSTTAFGWRVANLALDAGKSYGVLIPRAMPRAGIGTITLWTKGEIRGVNVTTGQAIDTRLPGMVSTQLGPLEPGRRVLTAHSDAEWWCIDQRANDGQLPEVECWRAQPGEMVNGLVLVCDGPDVGLAIEGYPAPVACYVMRFNRSK